MRKILLCLIIVLTVIVGLVFNSNRKTRFYLKDGEVVNIDFGFQNVESGDFKAESVIVLENTSANDVNIVKVNKSCSCHTVQLEPREEIKVSGTIVSNVTT